MSPRPRRLNSLIFPCRAGPVKRVRARPKRPSSPSRRTTGPLPGGSTRRASTDSVPRISGGPFIASRRTSSICPLSTRTSSATVRPSVPTRPSIRPRALMGVRPRMASTSIEIGVAVAAVHAGVERRVERQRGAAGRQREVRCRRVAVHEDLLEHPVERAGRRHAPADAVDRRRGPPRRSCSARRRARAPDRG